MRRRSHKPRTTLKADITAPVLQQTLPADNATGVSVTTNLGLGFSETVKAGSGLIKIYKADGTLVHSIAASDTSQVTFNPTKPIVMIDPSITLLAGTSYYVIIEAAALEDLAGNDYAGLSSPRAFNFNTTGTGGGSPPADITAPQLTGTSPVDGASVFPGMNSLTLNFNEVVARGTGNVNIYGTSDNSLFESISIGDIAHAQFSSGFVTIHLSNQLSSGTAYYVLVDPGAIEDLQEKRFRRHLIFDRAQLHHNGRARRSVAGLAQHQSNG